MPVREETGAGVRTSGIAKEAPSPIAFSGEGEAAEKGGSERGKIEKFLSLYPKKDTAASYGSHIYSYLDSIFGVDLRGGSRRLTAKMKEQYEELAERYFSEERDYYEDLLRYAVYISSNKPSTTQKAAVSVIRNFFRYNKVKLDDEDIKTIKTKLGNGGAISTEEPITKDIIRKVLVHMDLRDRTVTLVLASSGMRIGEALSIRMKDITFGNPTKIELRAKFTKTSEKRTTFISSEATEVLQEWLKQRDSYLEQSVKIANHLYEARKMNNTKDIDDDRIFPFSDTNYRSAWDNAFEKAGLYGKDEDTSRAIYRVHGLRKFFRTALGDTIRDAAEAIMGHRGYLTDSYRKYKEEQLAEKYLENEHLITIAGGGNMQELNDKLENTKEELDGTRTVVEGYKYRIKELEDRLKQVESEKERRIEPLLNELEDYPELKQMFNSFLTSFEHKVKAMKGEEPELEMTVEEAAEVKDDKWVKVKGK